MDRECGNCQFYQMTSNVDDEGLHEGECRRASPTIDFWWPRVNSVLWCGEFKPVSAPATKKGG